MAVAYYENIRADRIKDLLEYRRHEHYLSCLQTRGGNSRVGLEPVFCRRAQPNLSQG